MLKVGNMADNKGVNGKAKNQEIVLTGAVASEWYYYCCVRMACTTPLMSFGAVIPI